VSEAEASASHPMTRAYLLSFLARQYLVLKQGFDARYKNSWLVWEPGSWRAPPANAGGAVTRLPGPLAMPARAAPGDALCFELAFKADPNAPLRIGRADDSELVISDATVSREHCLLRRDELGWFVKASPSVKSLRVGGSALPAGSEAKLEPGHTLDLGEVKLTFLDPRRFCERVATQASKL
jgi:hypothetical protein